MRDEQFLLKATAASLGVRARLAIVAQELRKAAERPDVSGEGLLRLAARFDEFAKPEQDQ